jgi:hypothetical protein
VNRLETTLVAPYPQTLTFVHLLCFLLGTALVHICLADFAFLGRHFCGRNAFFGVQTVTL